MNMEEAKAFKPQAAVIANPSVFHIQLAQSLAEIDSHLLVEKPLAATLDGISELLATCIARNLVLMTAYNLRFLPSLQEFRSLICSGSIGRVLSVQCEVGQNLRSWRPDSDYRSGVSASRDLGGGVLLELSHEIDYLRWIFGEVAWVQAMLSKQSDLDIDVEDTAYLIMGFQADSYGRELVCSLNMDFIRQDSTRQCLAIGEQGSLRWNGLTGLVEKFPLGGNAWEQVFFHNSQRDESYVAEWCDYLACISNKNRAPIVGGHDGLQVMRIIEAARRSAQVDHSISISTI
jgi:predicted dehydrogenase